jgi:hypothetical protein
VEFRRWHGPPEKGRTFSRGWRGTSIRKQMPSETPLPAGHSGARPFPGHRDRGRCTSEKS